MSTGIRRLHWLAAASLLLSACADRALPFEGSDAPGDAADLAVSGSAHARDLAMTTPDLATAADMAARGDLSSGVGPGGPPFAGESSVAIPAGLDGESVAIGDVTGDGRPDVVVGAWAPLAQPSGILVLVYAQQATGALASPVRYWVAPTGDGASIALGDLDGDGRLDVAITNNSEVAVLHQSADGTLSTPQLLPLTELGTGAELVAIGDFNHDGRADLVATGWAADGVDVWMQTDQGTLAPSRSFACPHDGFDSIATADFDGDGALDIALASGQFNNGCLIVQEPGGFAPYRTFALPFGPEAIAGGDVNGDGRDDLVAVGNGNSGRLGVAAQASDGTLQPFAWMSSYDIPSDIVLADIDGDGRKDALVVHAGWNHIGLYRQGATGLEPEQLFPILDVGWGVERLAVGDINSDGRPDLVAVGSNQVGILYHR